MESALPQFLRDVGVTKVEVKKLLFTDGAINLDRDTILIHTRGDSITRLVTFLHEYLHLLHPEWSEEFIRLEERKVLIMLNIKEELAKIAKNGDYYA